MKKYRVAVRVQLSEYYIVEAECEGDAIRAIENGDESGVEFVSESARMVDEIVVIEELS